MKKLLLLSFMLCSLSLPAQSFNPSDYRGTVLSLQVIMTQSVIIPGGAGPSHPKAPLHAPTVTLDGYTLFIYSSHPDYMLQLLSDDETVVFETYVSSDTYEVELPSYLVGDYELQLQTDSYAFVGYVEL